MLKLIKPKSQADVLRNQLAVYQRIRAMVQAAKQLAAEEKLKRPQ
jgi:hypothetical protein